MGYSLKEKKSFAKAFHGKATLHYFYRTGDGIKFLNSPN